MMSFKQILGLSVLCVVLMASQTYSQETCVNVPNGGFEQDGHGGAFQYVTPSSWTGAGGQVVVRNGPTPWGTLNSGSGRYYAAIQGRGSYLQTTLSGLQPNGTYTLTFLTAERQSADSNERMDVTVNGQVIASALNPFNVFTEHILHFTASPSGGATIRFTNMSPAGDRTVFLDNVRVCMVTPQCVALVNPGFEVDAHGAAFSYRNVTGWTRTGRLIVAQNGNAPWGGLNSGSGAYYLAMQVSGSGATQTLMGLVPGTYSISFLAAERPDRGIDEYLSLTVNDQMIVKDLNPYGEFRDHTATFMVDSTGKAVITFNNTSPAASGDRTVFIDNVRVCFVPPSTTTTATTMTMTTATMTTHTAFADLHRQATETSRIQSELIANVTALQTEIAKLTQIMATQAQLTTRLSNVEDAIRSAMAALPPAPSGTTTCTAGASGCSPAVDTNDNGTIFVRAPAADVMLQTATCGIINPCDLVAALNEFRSVTETP